MTQESTTARSAALSVPMTGARAADRPGAAAGAAPRSQQRLDPRRDAGGVDDLLQLRQRRHGAHRPAPSSTTAVASSAGSSAASRSPSRWEQGKTTVLVSNLIR